MKLSSFSILSLVIMFVFTSTGVTTYLMYEKPTSFEKIDYPYVEAIGEYFTEKNQVKKNALIIPILEENKSQNPELIHTYNFINKKENQNLTEGSLHLKNTSIQIFELYSYAKRKNWKTILNLSFQLIQRYTSSIQTYYGNGTFKAKKVFYFLTEIESVTKNSKLRKIDKDIIFGKTDTIRKKLNDIQLYIEKKDNLGDIKDRFNTDLNKLLNRSKSVVQKADGAPISMEQIKNLSLHLAISCLVLFMFIKLIRAKKLTADQKIFENSDSPLAVLNSKGKFICMNQAFKGLLPFKRIDQVHKFSWKDFEKFAHVNFSRDFKKLNVLEDYITQGSFSKDNSHFLVKLSKKNSDNQHILSLIPKAQVEHFIELSSVPSFDIPEVKAQIEEVNLAEVLEEVMAELSILFQSKKMEVQLDIRDDQCLIQAVRPETYTAFKSFIKDLVLALGPKSKSKSFIISLVPSGRERFTLMAKVDVKLEQSLISSEFNNEEENSTGHSLARRIEILKKSDLGLDVSLDFRNNFDLENKYKGSNVLMEICSR